MNRRQFTGKILRADVVIADRIWGKMESVDESSAGWDGELIVPASAASKLKGAKCRLDCDDGLSFMVEVSESSVSGSGWSTVKFESDGLPLHR